MKSGFVLHGFETGGITEATQSLPDKRMRHAATVRHPIARVVTAQLLDCTQLKQAPSGYIVEVNKL
jgi:hypothetical protein